MGAEPLRRAPRVELEPSVEEFLTWLTVDQGRAANTVAAYRRDLSAYQRFVHGQGRSLPEVDAGLLDVYLDEMVAGGSSAASVARATAAIRGFHRFAAEELGADHDPTERLAPVRRAPRLPKALPEAEVARLIDAVVDGDAVGLRDRAMLELLYGTGMRVGELVSLDLDDLRSDTGLVRVLGKGNKERLVPLGAEARWSLSRWLGPEGRPRLVPRRWRRRGDSTAVFLNVRGGRLTRQGVWAVMNQRAAEAGVTGTVHPHVLRHSCATHMLAGGADVRVVQELLGHASVVTTQLYTKVTLEHLRRAYDAAHPRAGEHHER
ncbi:MAG: tyrosine recombinase [Actinomycetota bacterium]|nr:tyrosine recombinase [Actinomycetota bacterium]